MLFFVQHACLVLDTHAWISTWTFETKRQEDKTARGEQGLLSPYWSIVALDISSHHS